MSDELKIAFDNLLKAGERSKTGRVFDVLADLMEEAVEIGIKRGMSEREILEILNRTPEYVDEDYD